MKIIVFNDVDVRNHIPTGEYPILIRALNPYYRFEGVPYPQQYLERYRAVLDLYVDDIREETERGKQVFTLFNEEMAQQIRKFISIQNFDECVVHCSYGESRSPAIAIGVAHLKSEQTLMDQLQNNPDYHPNELILQYLLQQEPISLGEQIQSSLTKDIAQVEICQREFNDLENETRANPLARMINSIIKRK